MGLLDEKTQVSLAGFPQALEIMETWKITENSSMHGIE